MAKKKATKKKAAQPKGPGVSIRISSSSHKKLLAKKSQLYQDHDRRVFVGEIIDELVDKFLDKIKG